MYAKPVSREEQLRLITQCRQSGLSDHQWCQVNQIKSGTFYNWVSKLRRRGVPLPPASSPTTSLSLQQEVVQIHVVPDKSPSPQSVVPQPERNTCELSAPELPLLPAAEVLVGNATVRFYNHTASNVMETTLGILGGAGYVR